MSKSPQSLLTEFLAERDQPCPQCEYNLRNLQGSKCPECGDELVLRVNAAESRQRLLIAGLIGLSAGAGFNGLLLIYIVIQLWIRPSFSSEVYDFLKVCGTGLLAQGGATIFWLKNWRRIRRLPIGTRWLLMIACWVLTLIDLIIFSLRIK